MREIRLSGLEGGVVDIRHPYPYFIAKVATYRAQAPSGAACR